MTGRVVALGLLAGMLAGGCAGFDKVTSAKPIRALHAPPQVVAGQPFTVHVDFDDPCGPLTEEFLAFEPAVGTRDVNVRFSQRGDRDQVCPGVISMQRRSGDLVLAAPGRYRLIELPGSNPTGSQASVLVEAVPAGQPVPNWTPPPLAR